MQFMGKESFLLEFSKTMETAWPHLGMDGAQALAFKVKVDQATAQQLLFSDFSSDKIYCQWIENF